MKIEVIEKIKLPYVKVRNLTNSNGNKVPNQFHIITDEGTYFQSYQTAIALKRRDGQVILDPSWQCSVTTSKYRNIFLNETTKETQKKIDSGEYLIRNLN